MELLGLLLSQIPANLKVTKGDMLEKLNQIAIVSSPGHLPTHTVDTAGMLAQMLECLHMAK